MNKIYYHGSNSKFTTFDKSKIRENKLGLCFNFTDDYSIAYQYGDNILKVHLDLNNPITEDDLDHVLTYEEDCLLCDIMGFPKISKERFEQEQGRYKETIGSLYKVFKMKPKFIQFLQRLGYDGIAFPEDHHFGVFEPEQIKILNKKITEEFNSNFDKWFKGSKVVDKDGKPLICYHGTPNGGFNSFKSNSHFTNNKDYADVYHNQNASSISYKKTADNPMTYAVYVSIKNPFDTRIQKCRDIFLNEYQAYYSPDLTERGMVDWMEAEDLIEWLKEKHPEYDGLFADEGGTGGYDMPVQGRGISIIPFNSNQVKSVNNNSNWSKTSDNIYENFEHLEYDIYATQSAYDILNWMKNKPQPYRIVYDKNIRWYFIGRALEYIHLDLLQSAYDHGFYPSLDSAKDINNYIDSNILDNLLLFYFDPDNSPFIDQEKASDGYSTKYVYDFGCIYTHDLTPLENFDFYQLIKNPIKVVHTIEESSKKKSNLKKLIKQLNEVLAYAGSGVDYDKPSYKAIGLGEGHAAHGWGFYYAVDPDVADSYRLEAITGDTLYFFGKTYVVMDIRGFNDQFIDHGNTGLDIVLQYCYNQIKKKKELNVNEIINTLQRKVKYLKYELDDKLSDEIERAKQELSDIEQEIKDFIPDKKLKELQDELDMWKSDEVSKILDADIIERNVKRLEKQIENEKILVANENELNLLKNHKAKWSNRLGDLQDNIQLKDIKSIEEMLEFLNKNKNKFNKQNIFMISDNQGVVKKVELPDGPYIEEEESLQNQDRQVKNAFYKLCRKFGLDDGEMVDILGETGKSAYEGLCSFLQEKYGYHYKLQGTGKRADKIISRLLNQQGIKGIHYFGGADGECYVIFNQLDIKQYN